MEIEFQDFGLGKQESIKSLAESINYFENTKRNVILRGNDFVFFSKDTRNGSKLSF